MGPFNWGYMNYTDADGMVEINNEDGKLTMKNGLNFIDCTNAMFKIGDGVKVKSIVLDSCRRCQIQISDVVSAVEIINCQNIKMWCMGMTPSVSIDKTTSPHIIFTKGCIEANGNKIPDVTTAQVAAGNIEIPGKTDDDDMVTIPIPEQFIMSTSLDGKSECIPADHGD